MSVQYYRSTQIIICSLITLCEEALQPQRRAQPSVPAAATSTPTATVSTCTPPRAVSWVTYVFMFCSVLFCYVLFANHVVPGGATAKAGKALGTGSGNFDADGNTVDVNAAARGELYLHELPVRWTHYVSECLPLR
jgi:hypothetical protein